MPSVLEQCVVLALDCRRVAGRLAEGSAAPYRPWQSEVKGVVAAEHVAC